MYHTQHQTPGRLPVEVIIHDGLLSHVDLVLKNEATSKNSCTWLGIGGGFSPSWLGRDFGPSPSYQTFADSMKEPWAEGVAVIEEMLSAMAGEDLPKPKCVRRRPRWSEDTGDEISLDRLESGQAYWRQMRREQLVGPSQVSIAVCIGGLSTVRAHDLFWRGAAAVALSKILEEAGYSVEIWAYSHPRGVYESCHDCLQATPIKMGGDYLDVDTLACATSGWFFRTFMFGGYCLCPGQVPDSMGAQTRIPTALLGYMSPNPDSLLLIDGVYTYESAVDLIKQYLQAVVDGPKNLVATV